MVAFVCLSEENVKPNRKKPQKTDNPNNPNKTHLPPLNYLMESPGIFHDQSFGFYNTIFYYLQSLY